MRHFLIFSSFYFFATLTLTAFAQKVEIPPIRNGLMNSGLISTIRFGLSLKNADKDARLEDYATIKTLETQIGSKKFKFRIAYVMNDPQAPTFIGHFGLSGAIDQGNARYFIVHKKEVLPEHNLLIIDTLSSPWTSTKNCSMSIGGIEDIPAIDLALQTYWKDSAIDNKDLFLMGGSGSSAALMHGSRYLSQKYGPTLVKGVFIQSGYNSLEEPYLALGYDKKESRQNLTKNQRIIKKIMLWVLNKKVDQLAKVCPDIPKDISIQNLLEQSFTPIKLSMSALMSQIYPEVNLPSPSNYHQYLKMLEIAPFVQYIETPVFWLQSKDDPMSDFKEVEPLLQKLSAQPRNYVLVTPKGGHAAFKMVYGNSFQKSLILSFKNMKKLLFLK